MDGNKAEKGLVRTLEVPCAGDRHGGLAVWHLVCGLMLDARQAGRHCDCCGVQPPGEHAHHHHPPPFLGDLGLSAASIQSNPRTKRRPEKGDAPRQ